MCVTPCLFICVQRHQSGSKFEGVVNPVAEIFSRREKNFRFSGKMSDFPGKNSDDIFLVVNSQSCLFSLNTHSLTF